MRTEEFYKFIENNKYKDTLGLSLSIKKTNYNFDVDFAILQIEARRKYFLKLKSFLENERFLFPDYVSGEQASHQSIALYHSSLASGGGEILDMTAGLGIDSFTLSRKTDKLIAIELNPLKAEILKENLTVLNINNIEVFNIDSIQYLKTTNKKFEIIYVDPSRRASDKRKVYNLHDCTPDILLNQDLLLSKASKILIKASPLLDITQTIRDFKKICCIRAVGVKGECKEILIELDRTINCGDVVKLEAINLDNEGNIISIYKEDFSLENKSQNSSSKISFADENDLSKGKYVLEPSPMIMKISPWESICERYNSKKLGKSSHLFITDVKPMDFPGKVTSFHSILKKQDRKSLSGFPATVISKNHPMSADELRKSLHLKEGNQNFLYATRLGDKPIIFLTHSLESISR